MFKAFVPHLAAFGIASSLSWVALPSIGLPALAQSSPSPAPTQPEAPSPLLGEWHFKDADSQESISLFFAPEDILYFVLSDGEGEQIAIQMKYEVHPNTQPAHLDLLAGPEDRALTLFEFTPEGQLRIDLEVQPGDPRPQSFGDNAVAFERLSSATRPPADVEIIDLTAAPPSPSAVPVQFISIVLRGQSAFYRQNGKFAASIEELGLATSLETEQYRYQLQPVESSNRTAVSAIPKTGELQSYAGAIFVLENGSLAVGGICQSEGPSTAPPVPVALNRAGDAIQCPPGSTLLE